MKQRLFLFLSCLLFVNICFAHTLSTQNFSFAHGLLHPLTGIDHVLMSLCAGITSYRLRLYSSPLIIVSGFLGLYHGYHHAHGNHVISATFQYGLGIGFSTACIIALAYYASYFFDVFSSSGELPLQTSKVL